MGNLRSLKRNIARHPLQVWRAKKKAKPVADAIKPFSVSPAAIEEVQRKLQNEKQIENQSKPKEINAENLD